MVKLKEEQDVAEKLVPQRPYTRDFYPVLLCVVLPLGSIVPSAWCFVVYSLYTGKIWLYTPPKLVMFSVALCEVRNYFASTLPHFVLILISVQPAAAAAAFHFTQ